MKHFLNRLLGRVGDPRRTKAQLVRRLCRKLHWEDKLRLRHELGAVSRLDHDRHNILLHVESRTEWKARACACSKEPRTVAWIEANVRPGDVLYDVGANVGAYSLIAAAVGGGRARVYAFEPSFANFNQLCRNVLLNESQQAIIPLLVPLSQRTGLNRLYLHDTESGGSHHAFGQGTVGQGDGASQPFLEMAGFSLDDFVQLPGVEPPTLMKVDVDGLELNVLLGAQQTLRHEGLRGLLIEIDETSSEAAGQILSLLQDAGLTPVERHYLHEGAHNYVFARQASAGSPRRSAAEVPVVWHRPAKQQVPPPRFLWAADRVGTKE